MENRTLPNIVVLKLWHMLYCLAPCRQIVVKWSCVSGTRASCVANRYSKQIVDIVILELNLLSKIWGWNSTEQVCTCVYLLDFGLTRSSCLLSLSFSASRDFIFKLCRTHEMLNTHTISVLIYFACALTNSSRSGNASLSLLPIRASLIPLWLL